jgi:hypothetical protein
VQFEDTIDQTLHEILTSILMDSLSREVENQRRVKNQTSTFQGFRRAVSCLSFSNLLTFEADECGSGKAGPGETFCERRNEHKTSQRSQ